MAQKLYLYRKNTGKKFKKLMISFWDPHRTYIKYERLFKYIQDNWSILHSNSCALSASRMQASGPKYER